MKRVIGAILAIGGSTLLVFWGLYELRRVNHVAAYVVAAVVAILAGAYLLGSTQPKPKAP